MLDFMRFRRSEPEPAATTPTDVSPSDDPLFRALLMAAGLGCLVTNLTGLQSDIYAHRGEMTPEQAEHVAAQVAALHARIESVCQEIGGIRQTFAAHHQ